MKLSQNTINILITICWAILFFSFVLLVAINLPKETPQDYKELLIISNDRVTELEQKNEYLTEQVENYYNAAFTIYAEYQKCMNYSGLKE